LALWEYDRHGRCHTSLRLRSSDDGSPPHRNAASDRSAVHRLRALFHSRTPFALRKPFGRSGASPARLSPPKSHQRNGSADPHQSPLTNHLSRFTSPRGAGERLIEHPAITCQGSIPPEQLPTAVLTCNPLLRVQTPPSQPLVTSRPIWNLQFLQTPTKPGQPVTLRS
jgi:hypothetical protein